MRSQPDFLVITTSDSTQFFCTARQSGVSWVPLQRPTDMLASVIGLHFQRLSPSESSGNRFDGGIPAVCAHQNRVEQRTKRGDIMALSGRARQTATEPVQPDRRSFAQSRAAPLLPLPPITLPEAARPRQPVPIESRFSDSLSAACRRHRSVPADGSFGRLDARAPRLSDVLYAVTSYPQRHRQFPRARPITAFSPFFGCSAPLTPWAALRWC